MLINNSSLSGPHNRKPPALRLGYLRSPARKCKYGMPTVPVAEVVLHGAQIRLALAERTPTAAVMCSTSPSVGHFSAHGRLGPARGGLVLLDASRSSRRWIRRTIIARS